MWILVYHHRTEHFLKTAAPVLSERPHVFIASELQSKQLTHRRLEKFSPEGKKEFCRIVPVQSLNSDIMQNKYR